MIYSCIPFGNSGRQTVNCCWSFTVTSLITIHRRFLVLFCAFWCWLISLYRTIHILRFVKLAHNRDVYYRCQFTAAGLLTCFFLSSQETVCCTQTLFWINELPKMCVFLWKLLPSSVSLRYWKSKDLGCLQSLSGNVTCTDILQGGLKSGTFLVFEFFTLFDTL